MAQEGRVAVVGAGAIGLYYGARLALAGRDVAFLLRSDFDAVRRGGIRIESIDGDAELAPVQAHREATEIGAVDWIIVAWKATANDQLATVLPPMLHTGTQVLTLQNGLGNCEALAEVVGAERVIGGLCFVCINRIAPGVVAHTAGGKVTLGEWRAQEGVPRAQGLARAFREAGVEAAAVEDLAWAQWRKLVWNIPFNGLAIARGGVTTAELLADATIEAEIRALMGEVVAVARAMGLEIPSRVIDSEIQRTRLMGRYRPSSMIDYVEGQPVELEAIWLEPLRQARAAGVAVPRLEALCEEIRERLDAR